MSDYLAPARVGLTARSEVRRLPVAVAVIG